MLQLAQSGREARGLIAL